MDGSDTLEALARRVGRLERECRRWRRAGTAAALGAIALVAAVAAKRPDGEIKVDRITVQGKDGGGIHLEAEDGLPSLTFYSAGQERIAIRVAEGGSPTVAFVDGGAPRMTLGLGRNGAPILNFNDENRRRRISLGIFPKVGPLISVLDEQNKVSFKTP
jgi:hypothetical protein